MGTSNREILCLGVDQVFSEDFIIESFQMDVNRPGVHAIWSRDAAEDHDIGAQLLL